MRQAVGGLGLFQIVILFVLIFTGFICLSINQSRAYNVKDQILKSIESESGIDLTTDTNGNNPALEKIIDYLTRVSYRTAGACPASIDINGRKVEYVGFNRDGKIDSKNSVFCIAKIEVDQDFPKTNGIDELPSMSYYNVVVFFQLDLPVFRDAFGFRTVGETKIISTKR